MKRFIFLIITIFICTIAHAQTIDIDWLIGNNIYTQSTCEYGGDLIVPTAPTKYGYTFNGWATYTPIEYLESTGTQAIDTKYVFAGSNNKVVIQFAATSSESTCLTGAETPHTFIATFRGTKTCIWHAQNTIQDALCSTMIPNKIYTIEMFQHNNVFEKTIDGETFSRANTPSYTDKSFSLFSDNYGNGNYTQKAKAKIYYCQIYKDDVLVHDFIPVLDGDGVPCMYDKVEGKFYYNAGTGQFVAGPVIGAD